MTNSQQVKNLEEGFIKLLTECPEITYIGDPVLRQKADDVVLEEGLTIGNKLKEVLAKCRLVTGYGRGLAAPQIGENKSVFVTYVDNEFKVYINPMILKSSDEQNLYRETCLSCGSVSADVKRSEFIAMEFVNEQGKKEIVEADGFLARLLQHEYDHLQGIINIDIAEKGGIDFRLNDPLKEELRSTA